MLPRICPLQCINALPAFLLAISSFLLADTLREFMGAGVVLNFIKLIRITLKISLSRLRQTVLRANLIAVISPSCCLLPFRPTCCCFKALNKFTIMSSSHKLHSAAFLTIKVFSK